MCSLPVAVFLWGASLLPTGAAVAGVPEIAYVYPDFVGVHLRHNVPHVIAGEHFDAPGLEVWTWAPPPFGPKTDPAAIRESAGHLGGPAPELPAQPPKGAVKVAPLDVDKQVITVPLGNATAVWVKSAAGWSAPYRLNVAKPFWISSDEAEPGTAVHIFGLGLSWQYSTPTIALKAEAEPLLLQPRSDPFTGVDPRLVFFRVPAEAKPADYQVYVHNGLGGVHGWQKAGQVRVIGRPPAEERVLNVRQFGARGDGLANDWAAIDKAMTAAQQAGGGIVFFEPGTYLVDQSVRVPPGVTLRGAGRGNTIIRGIGYDPQQGQRVWYSGDLRPSSVILLNSRTALEHLSVEGVVSKGGGGYALVETVPLASAEVVPSQAEYHDITLAGCELRSSAVHPKYGTQLYRYGNALQIGQPWAHARQARRITLTGNVFHGNAGVSNATRAEIVGNTVLGGGIGGSFWDSRLEGNILKDAPSRFLVYPRRHTLIRWNEVLGFGRYRHRAANNEEAMLIHGGGRKTMGTPTACTATTLTDTRQAWKPGQYRDAVVVISAGRGFGQYRTVTDNTENTLTLDQPWRVLPDQSSEYAVGDFFADSVFDSNVIEGWGMLWLWLDCIGHVVTWHHDAYASGIGIEGRDTSRLDAKGQLPNPGMYNPAWYNLLIENTLSGSPVEIISGEDTETAYRGPVLFANYLVANRITAPHLKRTSHTWPTPGRPVGGIVVAREMGYVFKPTTRVRASHTVLCGNFIEQTGVGVLVTERARKTFVLRHLFQNVDRPIVDRSGRVTGRDNRLYTGEAPEDKRESPLPDIQPTGPDAPLPPREYTLPPTSRSGGRLEVDIARVRDDLLTPMGTLQAAIASQENLNRCQENLKKAYALLKGYEASHGALPRAAFYPTRPLDGADSLWTLLGPGAATCLHCPSAPLELERVGWLHVTVQAPIRPERE